MSLLAPFQVYKTAIGDAGISAFCKWMHFFPPQSRPFEFHVSHAGVTDVGVTALLDVARSGRQPLWVQ